MKISEKINDILSGQRGIIISIFALIFACGLIAAPDYGVSYDYPSENNILFSNIRTIGETFLGDGALDGKPIMGNLPRIENSKERDHGKAMYYPFALFRLIIKPRAASTYLAMKLYTFLINFIGLIFLYKTAVFIFKRRRYGLIAVALWLASPRMVADGFYNEKDMVFASLVIATIYFSLKIVEKPDYKTATFLAVTTAFAANTRILGLFFPFLALILYCITRTKRHEWDKKSIIIPFMTLLLSFAVMFIITPAMWYGVVKYFQYTIGFSANFSRWNGYVYYLGELYNNVKNPLPWHYIPVIFLMTTPVVISLFILGGTALSFRNKNTVLLLIFALLPPLFAIVGNSNVYNGWRHFFFVYPALILLAVGAAQFLLENGRTKNAAAFLLALQFIGSGIWTYANHPHEYVYFNFLSKSHAVECDLDYWNVSAAECLKKCLALDDGEFTISSSDLHSENALDNAFYMLSSEEQKRVTTLRYTQMNNADYIIVNPSYYHIAQKTAEKFVPVDESKFTLFASVECDGYKIMEIYKHENQ